MTQVRSPPDKAYSAAVSPAEEQVFTQVVDLIRASHERALTVVNSALIDLYWKVGELVARKTDTDGWGKGTVAALSTYIQSGTPVYKDSLRKRLANAAVLRRLQGPARSLNAVERIAMVSESSCPYQV